MGAVHHRIHPGEALGNRFLDAFLSFDPAELAEDAPQAPDLHEELYLQAVGARARATGSSIRSCEATFAVLVCTLEGSDALADALDFTYVDSFDIFVASDGEHPVGRLGSDRKHARLAHLTNTPTGIGSAHPELYEQGAVCDNFFGAGPSTPAACALAWLDAAPEYLQSG